MSFNAAILEASAPYLGLQEFPGAKHNEQILEFFADSGHSWVKDDETPWCAAFINAVLAQIGLPHTGKLNARSYLEYGDEVDIKDAKPGDICVFWRGSPDAATGHVAILLAFDGSRVRVRGGNQGNAVSDAYYPIERLLSIRRAIAKPHSAQPTLKMGSRGATVADLQFMLRELGYAVGDTDGIYGALTRDAVMAMQADNGLATDGVVGQRTWEILTDMPKGRPRRNTTEKELRERGSRTLKLTDLTKVGSVGQLMAGGAAALVSQGQEMVAAATAGGSLLTRIRSLPVETMFVLAMIVFAVIVYMSSDKIRQARVEDAAQGKHLGR